MGSSDTNGSPIARNRFAVAIVLGVGLLLLALEVLRRFGLLESLLPTGGPAAESVPLYLLFGLLLIATVVWSVVRVLSILE